MEWYFWVIIALVIVILFLVVIIWRASRAAGNAFLKYIAKPWLEGNFGKHD